MTTRYGDRTEIGNPVTNWGRGGGVDSLNISISPAPAFTSNAPGDGYVYYKITSTATFTVNAGSGRADVLIVGGGAGGAPGNTTNPPSGSSGTRGGGGGGGAGGVFATTIHLVPGSYTATIGGGGVAETNLSTTSASGSPSSFGPALIGYGGSGAIGIRRSSGSPPPTPILRWTGLNYQMDYSGIRPSVVGGSSGGTYFYLGPSSNSPSNPGLPADQMRMPGNIPGQGNRGGTTQTPAPGTPVPITGFRAGGGGGGGAGAVGGDGDGALTSSPTTAPNPWTWVGGTDQSAGVGGAGGNGTTWVYEPPATPGTVYGGGGGGGNAVWIDGLAAIFYAPTSAPGQPAGGTGGGGKGGAVYGPGILGPTPGQYLVTHQPSTAGATNTGGGGGGGLMISYGPPTGISPVTTSAEILGAAGGSGVILIRVLA